MTETVHKKIQGAHRPVGLQYEASEVQGIGTWRKNRFEAYQSMLREDLPGGGFRDAATSGAVYPLVDHQGSVRAYAGTDGIVAAYDYYPYGAVSAVYPSSSPVGERRWQDKELDDATGNYYFGARFYNPLLGMWLVPDPAGQYVDPYGYGGDPLNLIDPTGLWAVGAGLVFGYDKAHGFNIGLGFAFDVGVGPSYNMSYTWNYDGSNTANLSASLSAPIFGTPLWANFGGGLSYNSETGYALTGQAGVSAGVGDLLCVGANVGGGLYWSNTEFLGGTAYAEAYANVAGVYGASAGKEWGYGKVAGRGWYMGINAMGVHAGVSSKGGLDWGFEEKMYYKLQDLGKDPNGRKRQYVGLSISSFGILGDYFMYDHGNRNEKQTNFKDRAQFEKEAKDKGLDYDVYPTWASREHNPDKNVKMWMGRGGGVFNFLYGWFIIPSVEGVFDKNTGNTDYAYGPSYNYGNNFLTHFFLDWLPWKVMDVWFPNP